MKRRNFFKKLGITAATVAIAPNILAQENEEMTVVSDSVYWNGDGTWQINKDSIEAIRNGGWYEKYVKLENGLIYTDISIYQEVKDFHRYNEEARKYPHSIIGISLDWNNPGKGWLEVQTDVITPEYMELAKTGAPNVYELIKWNEEIS